VTDDAGSGQAGLRPVARALVAVMALAVALLSIWHLERARSGVEIVDFTVGPTPATAYSQSGADGPLVVIAHGFAGSRQMMQGYALTLARAGYRVVSFDFEGHGRHPLAMSGDVGSIEGTTQLLIEQTRSVVAAGIERFAAAPPAALLGHSMATDIIIRAALRAPEIGPVVGLSTRSGAVTAEAPADLLMITGEWEPGLRDWAAEALAMVDEDAAEGDTARSGDVIRRAAVAPGVEHVGILHSATGQRWARDWLDRSFGRTSAAPVAGMGPWILALLASIVALAWPLSALLPGSGGRRGGGGRSGEAAALSHRQAAIAAVVPAIAAPLIAVPLEPGILPILVADYLALHLFVFGAVQLALLRGVGVPLGRASALAVLALLVWGLAVFGVALDRYAANFWPVADRWWIIAALGVGALPFMVADALVTGGGRGPLGHRIGARLAFLASLGLAVALDFDGLFFLLMIAPVIVLFYAVYGMMGRWVAQRAGALSAGLAQALILAWAIGVSFPMFAEGG